VRVYLSVDMEGIGGISHSAPTERADQGYAAAVALMVGEANAAIEGACSAGASEIVVNDSHGLMFNLVPAELDPRAVVIQGQKPWSMVQGAGGEAGGGPFDVALFVGYHARAGHPRGTLGHTYSSDLTLVTLAGRPVGEYGLNALALGAWGIPVGLVAGDDALGDEVAEWLPWAEVVVVKHAIGQRAAQSVHPEAARERVSAAAKRAVERASAEDSERPLEPLRLAPPIVWAAEFRMPAQADFAAVVPGVTREGDRGLRYTSEDPLDAFRAFLAAMRLGGLVK
jgi:D-amino peptidase